MTMTMTLAERIRAVFDEIDHGSGVHYADLVGELIERGVFTGADARAACETWVHLMWVCKQALDPIPRSPRYIVPQSRYVH